MSTILKNQPLQRWLDVLGYSGSPTALHSSVNSIPSEHVYQRELHDLLDPAGSVRANAVFDVDGVPTVCFLADDGQLASDAAAFDVIRQRIWNQNLVSIVLTIGDDTAVASPVASRTIASEQIAFDKARPDGPFSRSDVQSGQVFTKRADWFSAEDRVDRVLLSNLKIIVRELESHGLDKLDAQLLMAQIMFVSYLEQRGIVGDAYRRKHNLQSLFELIAQKDIAGVNRLLLQLKEDFNGDLLQPGTDGVEFWNSLPSDALDRLHQFLCRVDLESNQQDFWNFDFRFIPVELISGIYESFLADDKRDVGAYYTPRHLAMLVVDLALKKSTNVLDERIYDGACGSGILLTTAYRRLLNRAESQKGQQLSFGERVKLLERSIFGSDLNASACRVTAFSLYLSVLEGLQPSDIAILTAQKKSHLPKLTGRNLRSGEEGDFFSLDNPHSTSRSFTVFLSNPPWVEPKGKVVLSSDRWAASQGLKIPRRQTAGAFLLRATDCVTPSATLCFILPVSLLAAPSSRDFMSEVLARYEVETLINFGDLRKLLFAAAKQPCIVLVARPRAPEQIAPGPTESIEYWVPKADVSFAFGRLTLHATDRHNIRSQSLSYDNEAITSLFWGSQYDVSLLTKLRVQGTLGDFLKHTTGWRSLKGFHAIDSAVEQPISSKALWKIPHLDAKSFAIHGPLVDTSTLKDFPRDKLPTIARLPEAMLTAFNGPRIVFTDGMTPERQVWAAFSSQPFSFSSSIGAIVAPSADEDLLRFLALYLQSDFVRYALLLTAYQVSFERERITVRDLEQLPFVSPEKHSNPNRAKEIIHEVAKKLRAVERAPQLLRQDRYKQWKPEAQNLIAEYLGLSATQTSRIGEVIQTVLMSVQPSVYGDLFTPLQQRPDAASVQTYARALLHELHGWKESLQGDGRIQASMITNDRHVHGALGILRLTPVANADGSNAVKMEKSDSAVQGVIEKLQSQELLPLKLSENLFIASDVVIRHENVLYLIKPLLRRFWMVNEALRDAERIVRSIQGKER